MNDILLIQPPIADFYQTKHRTFPLGLAYLAAALEKNGLKVQILDCHDVQKRRTIAWPPELQYLKKYYYPDKSPFNLFQNYYQFGEYPLSFAPARVYGISCSFSAYFTQARHMAAHLKNKYPHTPIIAGGAHATVAPLDVLEKYFDLVIIGQAESIISPIVDILINKQYQKLSRFKGIAWRQNKQVFFNGGRNGLEKISALDFPARHLLNPAYYQNNKRNYTSLITSRGCPYKCSFCSVKTVFGRQYQARSATGIFKEIKQCYQKFQIKEFHIEDDNFTFNRDEVQKLCRLLIQEYGARHLQLCFPNGLAYADLDPSLVRQLFQAGLQNLPLSWVSSDRYLQKQNQRPSGELDFLVNQANNLNLPVTVYHFLGLPGQTIAEMTHTLADLAAKQCLLGPAPFYSCRGTAYAYEKMADILRRSTAWAITTQEFRRLDLITLFRLTRIINHLKKTLDNYGPEKLKYILLDLPLNGPRNGAISRDVLLAVLLKKTFKTGIIWGFNKNFYEHHTSTKVMEFFFKTNAVIKGHLTPHTIHLRELYHE